MKTLFLTTTLSVLMIMPVQAQFFKKLKSKVEQRVENAVTNKIAEKAALEAEKYTDKLLNMQFKNSGLVLGTEPVDPADIPAGYSFDWEYTLDLRTSEGAMNMVYLLKEGAPYMGIRIPQAENLLTVLDNEKQMTVLYMTSEENNFVMANKILLEETEAIPNEDAYVDTEIKKIGTKNILGYECQGYQMENEENIISFYVTEEAGVSFADLYQTSQKQLPKGLEADWLNNGNALMMEMQVEDKKNPKNAMSMTCTGIEKKLFSVKTADYQNMGGKQ